MVRKIKFVKQTIAPGVSIGRSWETDYIYLAGKGHCDKYKSALKEPSGIITDGNLGFI